MGKDRLTIFSTSSIEECNELLQSIIPEKVTAVHTNVIADKFNIPQPHYTIIYIKAMEANDVKTR